MWQALAVAVVVAAGAAFLAGRLLGKPPVCKHDWASFDRSICPVDGWMHTYCNDCGRPLDGACGEEYWK